MAQKFKVGDKVYCPSYGTRIYTLEANNDSIYSLCIGELNTFTVKGKIFSIFEGVALVLATKENHKLLEQLYGIKFEEPKSFLEEHISNGSRVLCLVSQEPIEQRPNKIWKVKNSIRVICAIDKRHVLPYKATNGTEFQYAYPIAVDEKGNITYLDN